jgi:hypothetical protein
VNNVDPTGEDVQVGNRAVQGATPGMHAFLIVSPTGANREKYAKMISKQTGQITLSGIRVDGPDGERLAKALNDVADDGEAEETLDVTPPEGQSMEQFEENVIQGYLSYDGKVPYDWAPDEGEGNSNSLASGILDAAGASANKPDLTCWISWLCNVGWETPVKLPDATQDDEHSQHKKEWQGTLDISQPGRSVDFIPGSTVGTRVDGANTTDPVGSSSRIPGRRD